ncbi:hypothetical protein PCASD_14668 [Puccinia coronata f. sp. avenae]|uniref:Uncharacterized protein n=1 Tax=Puccinia coronata f. sp. avenae TaxID=200324 RepID=A0A2N5TBB6_9BASI|nr:hypothetical protein PCASD_14668 [Puccinia coronata f. sp. avenae]
MFHPTPCRGTIINLPLLDQQSQSYPLPSHQSLNAANSANNAFQTQHLPPSNSSQAARPASLAQSAQPAKRKAAPRKSRKKGRVEGKDANPTPANTSSSNQPAPPSNGNEAARPAPLAEFAQPAPRQSRKKRRVEDEDDDEPRYPQPIEELLKQSAAQLRKVAQENSKGTFSAADEAFFLEFYQKQEQELAIKAIERCVSLPMVHAFLGRRLAVREVNRWNRFLQTNQAREIFQQSGKGVKNRETMKKLSAAYSLLTPEEKAALVRDIDADDLDLDDVAGVTPANLPLVRATVPHLFLKEKAMKVLNKWASEAVNIAKTCNCEVVFFAVSKHLAKHSFRLSRCTPGAEGSVQTLNDIDGVSHFAARLQALVTGNSVAQLTINEKLPEAEPKSRRKLVPQVSAALATMLAQSTKNVLTEWPWTNTDNILQQARVKVVLSPKGVSKLLWIKTSNRHLHKVPALQILLDLREGHLKVGPMTEEELNNANVPSGADGGRLDCSAAGGDGTQDGGHDQSAAGGNGAEGDLGGNRSTAGGDGAEGGRYDGSVARGDGAEGRDNCSNEINSPRGDQDSSDDSSAGAGGSGGWENDGGDSDSSGTKSTKVDHDR